MLRGKKGLNIFISKVNANGKVSETLGVTV